MPRILVIDDDSQIRELLRKILEREGYEVFLAQDGEEGVKLQRQTDADIIITDIIMPEKEGIETIVEIKRDSPETKIIVISGGGRLDATSLLEMADRLGVHYSFEKPFDRQELLAAVRDLTQAA